MPQPPPDATRLFPEVTPNPPDRCFELGLVLGGTVSCGAYTAGALDFLTEALEAWHTTANRPHRVVLAAAAGTSGGAVCTAILGLLSGRRKPHTHGDFATLLAADPTVPTNNPLWDLWVNAFEITRLLATDDIDANPDVDAGTGVPGIARQRVPALLNARLIETAAAKLAAIGAEPFETLPWFARPFRAAVTVANLRGIPYRIAGLPEIGPYNGSAFTQHDDHAWFAFPNGADPAEKRPDEFWLDPAATPDTLAQGIAGYDTLVQWATASGSLPIGLVARLLHRPRRHYLYRPSVRPIPEAPGHDITWPQPDWTEIPDEGDGLVSFTAVDGGTFNNDPVRLVHRHIAGLVGRNPRGKSDAVRAILMIDPLADQPRPIDPTGRSLLAVLGALEPAIVNGNRYLTADMDLFGDENVFSRFQLVPSRLHQDGIPAQEHEKIGSAALCGSLLFAASGWCARAFRVHDYLLGRANMQAYLTRELVLAGDNNLFNGWSDDMRKDYATDRNGDRIAPGADKSAYFLPIIPLMPESTGAPLVPPPWPKGAYDPQALHDPVRDRLDKVAATLLADNAGQNLGTWLTALLVVPNVAGALANYVVAALKKELAQAGL